MMNYRHPTESEKRQIRELCDGVGAVEVLRVIAGIVANDHPDLSSGDDIRRQLLGVVGQLNSQTVA